MPTRSGDTSTMAPVGTVDTAYAGSTALIIVAPADPSTNAYGRVHFGTIVLRPSWYHSVSFRLASPAALVASVRFRRNARSSLDNSSGE